LASRNEKNHKILIGMAGNQTMIPGRYFPNINPELHRYSKLIGSKECSLSTDSNIYD
jgi:hypothetical protein